VIDDAWISRLVMCCVVDWIYVVRIYLFREALYNRCILQCGNFTDKDKLLFILEKNYSSFTS
jgi:hypothetical protein